MSRFCYRCGKDIPSGSGKRIFESFESGSSIRVPDEHAPRPINSRIPNTVKTKHYKKEWRLYCNSCYTKKRIFQIISYTFLCCIAILIFTSIGSKRKTQQDTGLDNNNSSLVEKRDAIKNEYIGETYKYENSKNLEFSKSNLTLTSYRNGDSIYHAQSNEDWDNANNNKIGAWCYYENNPDNGVLYNRYAINDLRGLVPEGFHIPTEEEWRLLTEGKDKNSFNGGNGGFRKNNCNFSKLGKIGYFWIAAANSENNNIAFDLRDNSFTHEGDNIKNTGEGYSVRYVKDY